jgi:hypothetical protein
MNRNARTVTSNRGAARVSGERPRGLRSDRDRTPLVYGLHAGDGRVVHIGFTRDRDQRLWHYRYDSTTTTAAWVEQVGAENVEMIVLSRHRSVDAGLAGEVRAIRRHCKANSGTGKHRAGCPCGLLNRTPGGELGWADTTGMRTEALRDLGRRLAASGAAAEWARAHPEAASTNARRATAALTPEQRSANARKGGRANAEWARANPEAASANARKAAAAVHALKDADGKSVHGRKSAAVTNARRVKCPHCGMVSTPAGIGTHRKAKHLHDRAPAHT